MAGPWNAGSQSLTQNPGGLPNVSDALFDWFRTITFTQIVKTVVNFQLVETPTSFTFQGVVQPFTSKQLQIKPEGQRSWSWFTIHSDPSLALAPDDIITIDGISYRVMQKYEWASYGFCEYHAVMSYTGGTP